MGSDSSGLGSLTQRWFVGLQARSQRLGRWARAVAPEVSVPSSKLVPQLRRLLSLSIDALPL